MNTSSCSICSYTSTCNISTNDVVYCWSCSSDSPVDIHYEHTAKTQTAIKSLITSNNTNITKLKNNTNIYSNITSDFKKKTKQNNRFFLLADLIE